MNNRYQVSEEFKQSCKENIGLNRYGKIHVVEDDLDIEGEQYDGQLVNFTIEDDCYVEDRFIGTTVAKKITVNILKQININSSLPIITYIIYFILFKVNLLDIRTLTVDNFLNNIYTLF